MKNAAFAMTTQLFMLIAFVFGLQTLTASPSQIELKVLPSHPIMLSDVTQTTTIKVGLTGFEIKKADRAPVNISLVLDKSGSMQGEKIRRAKEAAELVVNMLGPEDIFSLVVYSSTVETLIPSTKVSEKEDLIRKIRDIYVEGNTALFGGVSKGLAEVRKFLRNDQVNRVILLSDGLANLGPSSPQELGRLGASAAREGIAVTTIGLGLGYNEDLMTQLAQRSDGNHAFVENSGDLARIFQEELGDVLSVVAQEIEIKIRCPQGIKPVRILDRAGEIRGQDVYLSLNQIYSNQEKYVLVEVEVPQAKAGAQLDIATVEVGYHNLQSRKKEKLTQTAMVRFDKSPELVKKKINKKVAIQKTKAIANERSEKAIELRDRGDIQGASGLLQQNVDMYRSQGKALSAPELLEESQEAEMEKEEIQDTGKWKSQRKALKKKQYKTKNQTQY